MAGSGGADLHAADLLVAVAWLVGAIVEEVLAPGRGLELVRNRGLGAFDDEQMVAAGGDAMVVGRVLLGGGQLTALIPVTWRRCWASRCTMTIRTRLPLRACRMRRMPRSWALLLICWTPGVSEAGRLARTWSESGWSSGTASRARQLCRTIGRAR